MVMKMTMHIDEDVLNRVMQVTGAKTKKREAVEIALSEMARRHKLKELFQPGPRAHPRAAEGGVRPHAGRPV
jgi:Arc/MetJ family transcription regulator